MWNRGTILKRPEVQELLKRYVVAELWTDRAKDVDRENRKLLDEKYGSALPLYIIFTPDGREIARMSVIPSGEAFVDFLKKGL